jgi:arabinogalactan endo-1,4-beta-galactosidase
MNQTDIKNFADKNRQVHIETRERIGKLEDLTTTVKTDLVKAVNEVNNKIVTPTSDTDGGIIF